VDTVSVFHVDPNQLFREGMRRILKNSRFSIDGQATSLAEGLERIKEEKPDIVIIDVNTSGNALNTLMQGLSDLSPQPRVVVLTEAFWLNSLTNALCTGVDGYLLKDMSPDAFEQSLNLVLMGEKVFPTDLAHLLVSNRYVPQNAGTARRQGDRTGLSERETEILACLVNGYSNKSIANSLHLTEGTVKVHLKAILKKIDARNRTQAAIWALQHGIVSDGVAGQSNGPSDQNQDPLESERGLVAGR